MCKFGELEKPKLQMSYFCQSCKKSVLDPPIIAGNQWKCPECGSMNRLSDMEKAAETIKSIL